MNKFRIIHFLKQSIPAIVAMLSFTLLITGALNYSNSEKEIWEKDVKLNLSEKLITKAISLEKALHSRIHYTKSIAAYVSLKPNISNSEFYDLANELIKNDSVIGTMALSKDCIINAIFPEKGHEAAIGLDLLEHPERVEIVEKTIQTQKSFIAGPVELVEGGIAFITYTPIFDKTSNQPDKFWGVTDIVISRDKLIEQAGLKEQEDGVLFAIRGYNGLGNDGAVWWGNEEVFEQNPITATIELPYGNWILAAVPQIGWASYLQYNRSLLILLISGSFVISILIWFISRAIAKIKTSEQELNAIFHSMDSVIIEFDNKGKYIKIPRINSKLLSQPREELLNKTIFDVFPDDEAKSFHNAILTCLNTKELIEYEYALQIGDKHKWFAARISWKSEQSVIFHSFDITEQKNTREIIIKSEQRLKELNATKDRFFSIISHDLKSPFNSIFGFTSLLKDEYDDFDDNERKQFINHIHKSSESAFKLLENLLMWAMSQQGKIEIKKEHTDLKQLISDAVSPYMPGAIKKEITFTNSVSENIIVDVDKQTIRTVFANLISNAIKFTPNNGCVSIDVALIDGFVKIKISDNGVGISQDNLSKIFKIDESLSTLGTNNEKGTGLGLSLCKEFVEKNGGKIWVQSEVGKGSTFIFTLPFQ